MPTITQEGIQRLADLPVRTPEETFDAKIFAAVNFSGKSLELLGPHDQYKLIDGILTTCAALAQIPPIDDRVMPTFVETIVDNYGHIKPEEMKLALIGGLSGKVKDSPRTFQKINLEWVGGALAAYEAIKYASVWRVKKRLPELPERAESLTKQEVELEFWQKVVACVDGDSIPDDCLRILPEIFQELEVWVRDNELKIKEMGKWEVEIHEVGKPVTIEVLDIDLERKKEIFAVAQDIVKKKDERAIQFAAVANDFFNQTLERMAKDKTKDMRSVRLAREIACRELIGKMKRREINLSTWE